MYVISVLNNKKLLFGHSISSVLNAFFFFPFFFFFMFSLSAKVSEKPNMAPSFGSLFGFGWQWKDLGMTDELELISVVEGG